MFGEEVGVVHRPGLFKHVLGEGTLIQTGGGDRAYLVKAASLECLGQGYGLRGPLYIALSLTFGIGLHVINGRQMEKMVDLAGVFLDPGGLNPKLGAAQVTFHRDDLLLIGPPEFAQSLDLRHRGGAHQQVDGGAAIQQLGNKESTNEAGSAGNEIIHTYVLWFL